jgi:demethylsterigmatocystin 6-O-methyltransferase
LILFYEGRILRYLNSVGAIEETSKDSFKANNITVSLSDPGVQSAIYHKSVLTLNQESLCINDSVIFELKLLAFYFIRCVADISTFSVRNVGPVDVALPEFLAKHQYQDIISPTNTAFQLAYGTKLSAFIWLQTEPERLHHFHRYMQAEQKGLRPWLEVYPIEEKSQGLDSEQVFFVDIGGGVGHQAVGVKQWLPQVKNRIIVQDQEVVVPHAIKHNGVETMAYDFFQPQTIKGMTNDLERHANNF